MYRMNSINGRSLLALNQKQSLCIVTMISSVFLWAIDWEILFVEPSTLPVCKVVQGYPKETHSCSNFGCFLPGSWNEENPFPNSWMYFGGRYLPFFGYRTSNLGEYPHEQRCSYQSENLNYGIFWRFIFRYDTGREIENDNGADGCPRAWCRTYPT